MEDGGEMIRKVIGEFEEEYDANDYSITPYLDQIQAPLIIHQGLNDEAIPSEWTQALLERLRGLEKEVTYHPYPGENHNFHFGSAPLARERDLNFFKRTLNL